MKKIYIASPLGFSEIGRAFYNSVLIPKVEEIGYEVIDPWVLTDPKIIEVALQARPNTKRRFNLWLKANHIIGRNNADGLIRSDIVLAILDGNDTGTSGEIGAGWAIGKPIIGYLGDFRNFGDNEATKINLQIEYFILNSHGGVITYNLEDLYNELQKRI